MITPDDIKKKVLKQYENYLKSIITGTDFFPLEVSFGKIKAENTLKDFDKINKELQALYAGSKNKTGQGYLIEFLERKDRKIGRQYFPQKIKIETENDLIFLLNKQKELEYFKEDLAKIVHTIPVLKEWCISNVNVILKNQGKWDDLLKVCNYFCKNPHPNLYIRELPVEVHTKFIENNKGVIKKLLDYLISDFINNNETLFEKRYNLKYTESLIRIKFLDPKICSNFGGLTDISITKGEFDNLKINCSNIIIMENKINFSNIMNFLTLPQINDTIAVFGKGFNVSVLRDASWIKGKNIYYWGDIDTHGFQILSMLRGYFPDVKSIMMDRITFESFKDFVVKGSETKVTELSNLDDKENALYNKLLEKEGVNRLEQEKISHKYVLDYLEEVIK